MRLKIKNMRGPSFDVEVDLTTTVAALKAKINDLQDNAPVDRQRLIYRGKVLKDGDTIAAYGLGEGNAIHLVMRPNTATESKSSTQSQPQPQSQQQTHSHSHAHSHAHSHGHSHAHSHGAPTGHSHTGIFSSPRVTVNVQEGGPLPDLNALLGNVLGSFGLGANEQKQSTGTDSTTNPNNDTSRPRAPLANTQLKAVQTAFDKFDETFADSAAVPSVPPPPASASEEEQLAYLVQRLESAVAHVTDPAHSSNLQALRSHLTTAADTPAEQKAQYDDVHHMGTVLRRLGSAMTILGVRLTSRPSPQAAEEKSAPNTPVGPQPGQSNPQFQQPQQPQPQIRVQVQTHVFNSPVDPSNPPSLMSLVNQLSSTLGNPQGQQQQPSQAQPQQPAQQQPQQQPQQPQQPPNIGNLMSMMGPMMQQMMGGMQARQGQQAASQPAAPDMGSLFASVSQMLGSSMSAGNNGNANPQQQNQQQPQQQGLSLGDMFGDDINNEPLLALIGTIGLGDILQLVGGNWSSVQRNRSRFKEVIMAEMKEDSNDERRALSHRMADTLVDIMFADESEAFASVSGEVIDGRDPIDESRVSIRNNMRGLVNLIIDFNADPTTDTPNPFGDAVKRQVIILVGEWITVFGSCFHNGMESVQSFVRTAADYAFSNHVPPELSMMVGMVSGMLSSIVMRTQQAYQAIIYQDDSAMQDWHEYVSEQEKKDWTETIKRDVERQKRAAPQRPLSHAYVSGASSIQARALKRRKVGSESKDAEPVEEKKQKASAGLQNTLRTTIAQVTRNMNASELPSTDSVIQQLHESNVPSLYDEYLQQAVLERIESDPDYLAETPSRFPHLHQLQDKKKKK